LQGFKGTLQTDGYSGYHCVVEQEGVTAAGCWAHARRKFFEVWTLANKKEGASSKALDAIGKLYEIEDWMKEEKFEAKQIKEKRQEKSKPILEAFHAWLIELQPKVPPKSPLATAITYTLNQWQPLLQYDVSLLITMLQNLKSAPLLLAEKIGFVWETQGSRSWCCFIFSYCQLPNLLTPFIARIIDPLPY